MMTEALAFSPGFFTKGIRQKEAKPRHTIPGKVLKPLLPTTMHCLEMQEAAIKASGEYSFTPKKLPLPSPGTGQVSREATYKHFIPTVTWQALKLTSLFIHPEWPAPP
jgi:hypothetical protein